MNFMRALVTTKDLCQNWIKARFSFIFLRLVTSFLGLYSAAAVFILSYFVKTAANPAVHLKMKTYFTTCFTFEFKNLYILKIKKEQINN